jgi:hypothetical protein
MTEPAHGEPTRPELKAIVMHVDLADSSYRALAEFASRIAALLKSARVTSDPNAVATLDDLLGALYSLILARHHKFEDRTSQTIETPVLERRASQVQAGEVRIDGKWIAGWHFNSALYRVAAVYHRVLKVTIGDPETREYVPALRPRVQQLYRQWRSSDWSSVGADAICTEVNTLKHTSKGVYFGRTATFEEATIAVAELLDLVEAWNGRP